MADPLGERPRLFYWIDHTGSYEGNSGVQRVSRMLARGLTERGRELTYVVWSERDFSLVRAGADALRTFSLFNGPAKAAQAEPQIPVHLNIADAGRIKGGWLLVPEVTHHSPDQTRDIIAYCRTHDLKVAFIFYDLIPLLQEGYGDIRSLHERYVQQLALADLVIPISEHSADTLRTYYLDTQRLPPSELPEIVTALLGETFSGRERPAIADPSFSGSIRIASIGTIEPRKNQLSLLRAFNRLCLRRRDLDCRLTIVGSLHPVVAEEFRALVASNPRVFYAGYQSDTEMTDLYRRVSFTVFPSVEEGYGLPIVESLWFGRPSICAKFGAMAEVAAGGGCLTIDTRSSEAIEMAIERLASDPGALRALTAAARDRNFKSWIEYAGEIERRMAQHTRLRHVYFWVDQTVSAPYNSGIQRVVRSFGKALQDAGVTVTFVKWDAHAGSFAGLTAEEAAHLAKHNGPRAEPGPLAPDKRRGDWLIVPELIVTPNATAGQINAEAARLGLRTAYIFYDLIPLKLSEKAENPRAKPIYSKAIASFYEAFWAEMSKADAILPIAIATGVDLKRFFQRTLPKLNNLDRRIVAVQLAGNFAAGARPAPTEAARPAEALQVLSVSTIEPRKNQLKLLRAFRKAANLEGAPPMHLVIVGSDKPYPDLAAALRAEIAAGAPASIISGADDASLTDLYQSCDFVVYASYAEGFGLPIIESIWYGKPCLCHNEGALAETAAGGGVDMVDMLDEDALAAAIYRLATDRQFRSKLAREARERTVKSWVEYAREVVEALAENRPRPLDAVRRQRAFAAPVIERLDRPLLSIAVTTYNRAGWIKHSLAGILQHTRHYRDAIEVLVCDNASTDQTPEVVASFRSHGEFAYFRNPKNVGMLGNLGVTAKHARGEYIWVIGDDDLLAPGVIENVLEGILDHPQSDMIYLNYAYTHFDTPEELQDAESVIAGATAIAEGGPNRFVNRLRDVTPLTENFFTAIYACIFRRHHAILAYGQNIAGPPFSSLRTCVPSTLYAMKQMLDLPAYWVGEPGVVVNMNVSWRRWVLFWHLQRMPELYDWAEWEGMSGPLVDRYRWGHCQGAADHVRSLYFEAEAEMRDSFDIEHFIAQCLYLPNFRADVLPDVLKAYRDAYDFGKAPPGSLEPRVLAQRFGLGAMLAE